MCEDTKVDVSISGLPGKIAAGSGWHKFSLNVLNNSDSTLNDLDFFAGASPDKNGEELFTSKQVKLQAWDPDGKVWTDLNEGGYAVGYVGYTDELKPEYEVDIPLRLNVSKSAPVGAGFSLGATIYGDNDAECTGFGDVSYKFQIVSAGTDTGGTKPQEGGRAPVTDEKPSGNTPEVTGSLAETGSSSALPMISLVGGAAVVAGAGAIFVVRRRKAGDAGVSAQRPTGRLHQARRGTCARRGAQVPLLYPAVAQPLRLRRYRRHPQERQLQRAERLRRDRRGLGLDGLETHVRAPCCRARVLLALVGPVATSPARPGR